MGELTTDPLRLGDVIVAPATPHGSSALAVVRLSGPEGATLRVARRLAPSLSDSPREKSATLRRLVDVTGAALDHAIVLYFAAPRSSTGEEVIEFICHGSPAIVEGLLESARAAGARPARAGEFTRRALLNGKLDLAAAEGVGLLVAAESRQAARRSLGLMEGSLSRRIHALRERLLDLLARIEGSLDFSEEVPARARSFTRKCLEVLAEELDELGALPRSCAVRERIPTVVILGRPNAGKSTLFNALVGADRAIVTPIPGTTRDALSEVVEVHGVRLRLLDTAGLREPEDEIERLGVEVSRRAAAGADLILYAIDASRGARSDDESFFSEVGGTARLVVATKSDLAEEGERAAFLGGAAAVPVIAFDSRVSALRGEGIDGLSERIAALLGGVEVEGELLVLERHREALARTKAEVRAARELVGEGAPDEFLAATIRRALGSLGEITGETTSEDLLDRIFATFCVGK